MGFGFWVENFDVQCLGSLKFQSQVPCIALYLILLHKRMVDHIVVLYSGILQQIMLNHAAV